MLLLAVLVTAGPCRSAIGADASDYASDLRAAQKAIDGGERKRARELLQRHTPTNSQVSSAEFAWRYLWRLATSAAAAGLKRDSMPGLVARNIESPLVFLPGGNRIASACADSIARQFDLKTLEPVVEMAGVEDPLLICADGHTLIASGYSGLQVWDLRSQNLAPIWYFPRGNTWRNAAFTRDGKWAVVGHGGGQLQFIDVIKRRELGNLPAHAGNVRAIAFAPDGRTFASAGMDRVIRLWDFTRRTSLGTLTDHNNTVVALAFSPDGRTLASAGADSIIRLWAVPSGATPRRLAGHQGTVWTLAYSADGRTLASGGDDGTIRLWDAMSGTELLQLRTSDGASHTREQAPARLAFSPDGNLLAARLFDGTLQLWHAAELAATAAGEK